MRVPASSSNVRWKIPPFIGCKIHTSITPQNFSLIQPFKLRETSDECINFWICFLGENQSDPSSSFSVSRILDILFGGIFLRVLCVGFKYVPQILNVFRSNLHCHADIKPARPCCSTAADLRQHRLRRHSIEPMTTTSDLHLGKPTKSSASWRTNNHQDKIVALWIVRVGHASIVARSLLQPALTASQVSTCVGITAPLLLQADVHHADLL